MNRYRLLIKSGWPFSGIGWSFSDLGWSFSVSTRPKKYRNVDQLLVVRATHRSGFGSKLPRFPTDSRNEAMPWMGYGLKGVRGAVETGWIFQEADEESGNSDGDCDNCGRDRGTVRAREGPNPFPPIDLNDTQMTENLRPVVGASQIIRNE